ncbi:MAG: hypothetical protein ACR2OB_13460 [Solirubrobacteraceae bacterium]
MSLPARSGSDKLRNVLNPSALTADRLAALETQVAYLAQRLGVSVEELEDGAAPAVPDEVRRLLAERRRLPAMKVYRQSTGASLAGTKRAVDAVQRSVSTDT